ncbi:MAG: hypothetical protein LUG61_04975 [Lachnospiraceae bacterium]|nr:hypothetical protein [Lachnospiraceae bacterium]
MLKAKTTILYNSRIYKPGSELPASNAAMVAAWTAAGTAVWVDDDAEKKTVVKAKLKTAEPGLAGKALSSEAEDGDNLVGKVPKTTRRRKKQETPV